MRLAISPGVEQRGESCTLHFVRAPGARGSCPRTEKYPWPLLQGVQAMVMELGELVGAQGSVFLPTDVTGAARDPSKPCPPLPPRPRTYSLLPDLPTLYHLWLFLDASSGCWDLCSGSAGESLSLGSHYNQKRTALSPHGWDNGGGVYAVPSRSKPGLPTGGLLIIVPPTSFWGLHPSPLQVLPRITP